VSGFCDSGAFFIQESLPHTWVPKEQKQEEKSSDQGQEGHDYDAFGIANLKIGDLHYLCRLFIFIENEGFSNGASLCRLFLLL
jgi:hypothetical protein